MSRETAIVVLHYNKSRLTQRCVQSILDAGYPPERVHCFDNGSKIETFEELRRLFSKCNHARVDRNLGFSGGFNRGLEHVFSNGFDSAFFCTNDTVIEAGAVESSTATAIQTGAGMVAPRISYLFRPGEIDSIGAWFEADKGLLHHYHEQDLPPLLNREKDYIPGTAMWVDRKAFETLEGTDESFHMYWEDVDLSFRAHREGIPLARCYQSRVSHGVGQTNRKKPLYTTYYFLRNRIRFCRLYLQGELQQKVLHSIREELIKLGKQWEERDDNKRVRYFHMLMEELGVSA